MGVAFGGAGAFHGAKEVGASVLDGDVEVWQDFGVVADYVQKLKGEGVGMDVQEADFEVAFDGGDVF